MKNNIKRILAEKEGAYPKLCQIATYLHDIGRTKEWHEETLEDNHGTKSAELARPFLEALDLRPKEVEEIRKAISSHCFFGTQKTLVAKILRDADKLNHFSDEMRPEYLKYWTEKFKDTIKAEEMESREREKYLGQFHSKTAKKIAEVRTRQKRQSFLI